MLIRRHIENKLLEWTRQYPVVTVTGPRQSGKTTLGRYLFSDQPYRSLEDPDVRTFARTDPRGFLAEVPDGAVSERPRADFVYPDHCGRKPPRRHVHPYRLVSF